MKQFMDVSNASIKTTIEHEWRQMGKKSVHFDFVHLELA